jgi:Gram-negative bacterial TonB protein C-terminal
MTFESFLTAGKPDPRTTRGRRRALALALGVHVVMLLAAVVHAGWRVDEISPPSQPIILTTFPAPPPPAGSTEPQRPRRRKVKPRTTIAKLMQPPDPTDRPAPDEQDPRETDSADVGPGERNNTGPPCIGASCEGPPTPTTFVAPNVASGQLAIDPHAEPYRVKLPPALNRAGMRLWLLAKICVRSDGQVERVSLIRGADGTLDPLVLAMLKTWRYRPYSVNGRPVPFCTNVRYEIATQ